MSDMGEEVADGVIGLAVRVRSVPPTVFLTGVVDELVADPQRMGRVLMGLAALVDPDEDEDAMLDRIDRVVAAVAGRRTAGEQFTATYRDLRSAGLTHVQIADRLQMPMKTLLRRCSRAGVWVPEAEEVAAEQRLARLCAAGRRFSAADMPMRVSESDTKRVFDRAVKENRIQVVGVIDHPLGCGGKIRQYEPIGADGVAS